MKTTCNRAALLAAFQAVAGVVPSRSPKPILQNVKLTVDGHLAVLSATDLEVGIRREFEGVEADEPGDVLLPADRFGQILKASRDDELTITADGDSLRVRGARSSFTLPLEDVALFPDVPGFDAPGRHVVLADDLRKMIRRTHYATDFESSRFALGGCLVERTADSIAFVGTDGRRLARATADASVRGEPQDSQAVVPIKALKLIERNLPDSDDVQVDLAFNGGSAMVRFGGVEILSRLVEGRFPRYQDVFPDSPKTKIAMNVGEFRASIGQAAIVTTLESKGVDFTFADGSLTLTSQSADKGSAKIDMPLLFDATEPLVVGMDPDYVLDPLRVLDDAGEIVIELVDDRTAVVLRAGEEYACVIMPLTRER